MPVPDTDSSVSYPGNNSTITEYVIPFYFLDADHIKVSVLNEDDEETILEDGDYVVSGAGEEEGGTLTTDSAIPVTSTVTIYRDVDLTQLTELPESGRLPVRAISDALDKLTMADQQLLRQIGRAIRTTESSVNLAPLVVPEGTTDVIFGLNSSGASALLDRTAILAFMNLANASIGTGMKIFTEATKAAAVPDFIGQLGVSYDAGAIGDKLYVGSATTAGSWTKYISTISSGSVVPASLAANVQVTAMWADTTARNALAPAFAGQIGLQIDTKAIYYATGTSAGNWTATVPVVADGSLALGKLADVTGAGFVGKKDTGAGAPAHVTFASLTAQTAPATGMSLFLLDGTTLKKTLYEELLAALVASFSPAWASWTPALTASSSNPTLGSGSSQLGSYVKIGKMVMGRGYIAFGSSGAANGSGNYQLSLPVAASTTNVNPIGTAIIVDSNTATVNMRHVCPASATICNLRQQDGALVTQAAPWAWAANDYIAYSFFYEAA